MAQLKGRIRKRSTFRYDARLHEVKQRTVVAQEELRQLQAALQNDSAT